MKRIICLILILIVYIGTLAACGKSSYTVFSKVDYETIPKKVQDFFDLNSNKNGVYLYTKYGNQDQYIFLNSINVSSGEKAEFFKDIKYDITDDRFNIYITTDYTSDYSKKTTNKIIYKLRTPEKVKRMDLHKNGTHIPFEIIGN